MNSLRLAFRLWGAVVLAAAAAGASATEPRVLNVCVVDAARNHAVDVAFQQGFASRIGELACASVTDGVRTNTECVSSREAANRLSRGACDAVLVVGPDRPWALQRIEAVALAGALGWERNCTKVYLVVSTRQEPRIQAMLAEGFRAAVSAETQPARKVALR